VIQPTRKETMSLVVRASKPKLTWTAGRRSILQLLGPAAIKRGRAGRQLTLERQRQRVPGLPFGKYKSTLPGSFTKVDYHCSALKWSLARNAAPQAAQDLMTLLDHMKLKEHQVDLHFCGDKFIRKLNKFHRNEDKATDVISLAIPEEMQDNKYAFGLLGEMFISIETAQLQAKARSHPLRDEMRILVVHSVLHLLGHDHLNAADAAKMAAMENKLLAELDWTPKGVQGGLITAGDVLGDDETRSSTARDTLVQKLINDEAKANDSDKGKGGKGNSKQKKKKAKKKEIKPKSVLGNKSKTGKAYKPVSWKKK
jgi:probable rRNA maturation factor